jgi:alkylation response protein AidB-like acyl-CoA dehydrogenase
MPFSSPTKFDLVRAAEEAAKLASEHSPVADTRRCLHPDVVQAIMDAGFARYFVPSRWGGQAGSFTEATEAVSALGEGCASAAWCASLTASLGRMAAYLPGEGQAEVWQDGPDALIVGALMPVGTAERVPQGWRLSGRWPYVSIIDFSQWALVCATTTGESGHARFFLIPRDAYTSADTWRSVGMRGTGSNSLIATDVFVPDSRTFARDDLITGQAPEAVAPCHRAPLKAVNGLSFAGPIVGAARGGLRIWAEEVTRRAERTPGGLPASAASILARSSGELDAAWLLLERAAAAADHEQTPPLGIARSSRDCALATDLAVTALNRLFRASGTSAQQENAPLQRFWRDANSAASHVVLQFEPAAAGFAERVLSDQSRASWR